MSKEKRLFTKTPSFLILTGLLILVSAILVCQLEEGKRLNNDLQSLGIELTQTGANSSQTTVALSQEGEKIIAARELREFSCLEELKEFLAEDDTNEREYIRNVFDCEDFARMLQRHALEAGYLINCQKLPVQNIEHMANMAVVGNAIYYIEPMTDEVIYAGSLDP